jgi:hypothetical protein
MYLHVYIEKHLLQNQHISVKVGTKHPWVKRIVQKKGQVLFQGEIITEMQK